MSKPTLLVDFDIVAYKHAYMNELHIDWKDGTYATVFTIERAKYNISRFLESLLKRCGCTMMRLFVTGQFNFRYAVLETYKHNRVDTDRPSLIMPLKEWAAEEYGVESIQGLEADDLLGIAATHDSNTVLATIDKDLKQIPCTLYLWNKDTLEDVSEHDATMWFYRQCLTGDSTDGYEGCPGIGPKKADEILQGVTDGKYWTAIVGTYVALFNKACTIIADAKEGKPIPKKDWWTKFMNHCESAGSAEAYALMQARVARICRVEDFDVEGKKAIWWTPKDDQ